MKTITVTELQQLLADQPDLILVDVRTPAEFAEVHVPQARNEPLGGLNARAFLNSAQIPEGRPLYLICLSANRSAKAAERFAEAGWSRP